MFLPVLLATPFAVSTGGQFWYQMKLSQWKVSVETKYSLIPHTFDSYAGLMTRKNPSADDDGSERFELNQFFPYRVRVFYTHVSSAVAEVYQHKHDMTPAEWRCMAILNLDAKMTAADIVLASSMDKVTVSRAISKLRQKGWVTEAANREDRRSKLIKVSASGYAVLADLIPKALEIERQLLDGVSEEHLRIFDETMARISDNRSRFSKTPTAVAE